MIVAFIASLMSERANWPDENDDDLTYLRNDARFLEKVLFDLCSFDRATLVEMDVDVFSKA